MRLWDVETLKETRTFYGHTGSVTSLAYSAQVAYFVLSDFCVIFISFFCKVFFWVLGHTGSVTVLALSAQVFQKKMYFFCVINLVKRLNDQWLIILFCFHLGFLVHMCNLQYVQPIADRVAQYLEIISETFPTNQNSVHCTDVQLAVRTANCR